MSRKDQFSNEDYDLGPEKDLGQTHPNEQNPQNQDGFYIDNEDQRGFDNREEPSFGNFYTDQLRDEPQIQREPDFMPEPQDDTNIFVNEPQQDQIDYNDDLYNLDVAPNPQEERYHEDDGYETQTFSEQQQPQIEPQSEPFFVPQTNYAEHFEQAYQEQVQQSAPSEPSIYDENYEEPQEYVAEPQEPYHQEAYQEPEYLGEPQIEQAQDQYHTDAYVAPEADEFSQDFIARNEAKTAYEDVAGEQYHPEFSQYDANPIEENRLQNEDLAPIGSEQYDDMQEYREDITAQNQELLDQIEEQIHAAEQDNHEFEPEVNTANMASMTQMDADLKAQIAAHHQHNPIEPLGERPTEVAPQPRPLSKHEQLMAEQNAFYNEKPLDFESTTYHQEATPSQDFSQNYAPEAEQNEKSGQMPFIFAGGFIAVCLVGFLAYLGLSGDNVASNAPLIKADKSELKIFPEKEVAKNEDRVGVDNQSVNLDQAPSVVETRENVIDQSTKIEDRVTTSPNIVADNSDRDIQNVLTLLKSNVNNSEVLLKADKKFDENSNKIGVDGLKTNLVDAKQVKLDDLINKNQVAVVPTPSIDDLPVVGGNDNAVEALPDTRPIELPSTNEADPLANLVSQLETAPKPVKRPEFVAPAPAPVPNTIATQTVPTTGGSYGVQLASLPNEAAARNAYAKIAGQYPTTLAAFGPIIREAVIPGKGTFYRVFAGPLNSYNEANQLCATLRSQGIAGCFARKMQ